MHLVLINQYYPPDEAPTGQMLGAVAEALADMGHGVTILCSKGGYAGENENSADSATVRKGAGWIRVLRVGATGFGRKTTAGKLLDYLSFYLSVSVSLSVLRPRPRRIVALTTPPFLSCLARGFSKWAGGDHAHWIMDLYPDVMTAHGIIRENSLPHRILGALARLGMGGQRNAAVVTLGPDMAEKTRSWLSPDQKVTAIPLWSTTPGEDSSAEEAELPVAAYRQSMGWLPEDLVVMYSGNMGLGHRFQEFLQAARRLRGTKVRFVFAGSGRRRAEVETFLQANPGLPLEIHSYVPREKLNLHLLSADVHLASLEPAWDGTMVPSKLQGIFSAARPVIFVGTRTCSMGRWIIESGGGWVVGAGDLPALINALEAARDAMERHRRGQLASRFAREHFSSLKNASAVASALSA